MITTNELLQLYKTFMAKFSAKYIIQIVLLFLPVKAVHHKIFYKMISFPSVAFQEFCSIMYDIMHVFLRNAFSMEIVYYKYLVKWKDISPFSIKYAAL